MKTVSDTTGAFCSAVVPLGAACVAGDATGTVAAGTGAVCAGAAGTAWADVAAVGAAGFGDGKIHGVTPMITALRSSARRNLLSIYGIGSNPPALNGWQREILFAAYMAPFNAPCFSIASIAYCEQVG